MSLAFLDQATEFHERPTISLRGGDGAATVRRAVEILAAGGGLFNRSGTLVRVLETGEARVHGLELGAIDGKTRRDDTQPLIVSVTADYLRFRLDELASFERCSERGSRTVNCPKELALSVLALGEWKGIPILRAIMRAPFLRSDGSICDRKGYDTHSKTLLFTKEQFPPIPENPDRAAALAALEELREPFREMPFASPAHESAYLAYLLTLAVRPIVPTSPAMIFQSPTPGTGKGLACDCAGIIVHGNPPAKRSFPKDQEEMRKTLRAIALVGDPVVVFDNVPAGTSIGSDSLNLYLTAETVGDRTLGVSDARPICNIAVFAFTGNNIGAKADFVRRSLAINLDADCERPEERRFAISDLRAHVLQHRPRLLRAVLTILRAFVCAGAPALPRHLLGSFEEWDRLVTGCLLWLGLPDPIETQKGIRADDPQAATASAVFEALDATFAVGGGTFTVGDVKTTVALTGQESSPLSQAIKEACGTPERLGHWLRARKGQIHAGRKLSRQTGSTAGHAIWRIARLA